MNIIDRAKAPTPKFFKSLRNIGLVLGVLGSAILTAPISLPAVVSTLGGYLVVFSGALTGVSQITVDTENIREEGALKDGA